MATMVRTPINKKRYILAFGITTFIFLLGLLVGYSITGLRLTYTTNFATEQRLTYESLQVQTLYMSTLLQQENCPALLTTLNNNINDVEQTGQKLEEYIKDGNQEDYLALKRQYILAQTRYWLLAEETQRICEKDNAFILYFYAVDPKQECTDCTAQGTILNHLKATLKTKLLIFSFDANFAQEPLLTMITTTYKITTTPSIVLNGKTYAGLQENDALLTMICNSYKTKPEGCL